MSGAGPADPSVDLTSLTDIQAWMTALQVTTVPPDQLQQMVTSMSDAIQNWLGFNLLQQDYNVTFDGSGNAKVAFANSPVTDVSSLTIDGVTIPKAPDSRSCGFAFSTTRRQSWLVLRGYRFCPGLQNCSVSYTAGYTAGSIPPSIVGACREAITAYSQVTGREPGLTKEKVGGLEEDYAPPSTQVGTTSGFFLTPTITLALAPLRRVVPAW
jgi:hypothetical protein